MSTFGKDLGNPEPRQAGPTSVASDTTRSQDPSSQPDPQNPQPAIVPTTNYTVTRSIRQRKRPSQRRINANRQNAKRSTGPRTTRGKKTVSQNAIKHGVFASEVVITGVDGEEDPEQFKALYSRMWEAWQPVGTNEEMLVEEMAVTQWRRARMLRAENGEISKSLNSAAAEALVDKEALASQDMFRLHVLKVGFQIKSFSDFSTGVAVDPEHECEAQSGLPLHQKWESRR